MPVYDPSKCSPKLLSALWRAYCGVADTINTDELGQTDQALEDLKLRLLEKPSRASREAQQRGQPAGAQQASGRTAGAS